MRLSKGKFVVVARSANTKAAIAPPWGSAANRALAAAASASCVLLTDAIALASSRSTTPTITQQ